MSPSERAGSRFQMRITLGSGDTLENDEVRVLVFDHQNRQVHSGHGDLQVDLPAGIYTVRIEFGSQWRDEIVRHADGSTRVNLTLPERPSPVPVFGTSTAHEYYSYTSSEISKRTDGGNSGLFLFVRAHDRDQYGGEDLWDRLYLLDDRRKRIQAFGPANGEFNSDYGFYGAVVPLPPGLYILQNRDRLPREMPLYVYDGWQTQLFVFFRNRRLFESATVLMSHWGQGFNPDDRVADAIDIALRGLQSGTDLLPNRFLDYLLTEKFENPMLGLLGAHYLLAREDPDRYLLETVLHNINYLMPDSPDVAALAVMARARLGMDLDFGWSDRPPMMRAGLDALYDLNAQEEAFADLIPQGGMLEAIAPHRYIDSAYTSWKPPRRVRSGAAAGTKGGAIPVEDWIVDYLRKQRAAAEASNTQMNLRSYARRLNLPLRTVRAAWEIVRQ